jgi:hypothetical protein
MPAQRKVSPFQDFREELIEKGSSTTKGIVKSVTKIPVDTAQQTGNFFLDLLGIKNTTSHEQRSAMGQKKEMELRGRGKFTQLDVKKIREQHESPEEKRLRQVRELLSHYHQLQKGEEKKAVQKHEQAEHNRLQRFQQEEEEKKRKKQQAAQQSGVSAPKGKERKSIFGKVKKKASQVETKASAGKQ